jgi:hypothetical protein
MGDCSPGGDAEFAEGVAEVRFARFSLRTSSLAISRLVLRAVTSSTISSSQALSAPTPASPGRLRR